MKIALGDLVIPGRKETSLLIEDGVIVSFDVSGAVDRAYGLNGATVLPGAVDVHAHLREPGYEYKETILRATESAAKGGITRAFAMPNLIPVPDSVKNLKAETERTERDAKIAVYPFAALTKGERGEELSDIEELSRMTLCFSDDGVCVNDLKLLEEGMKRVKAVGGIIASHAERRGAKDTRRAEFEAVEEELELVKKTGVRYHFCHLSTKESFELLKKALAEGLDVTAEVTPHHLTLNSMMIRDGNWKMNPPLRSPEDVEATREALISGLVGIIATDHAPHSIEEKARPYESAPNGILGFETLFPVVYTSLTAGGKLSWGARSEAGTAAPAKRFGIDCGKIEIGRKAELIALNVTDYRAYTAEEIAGKAKNSPYIGKVMTGFNVFTLVGEKVLYRSSEIKEA